MILEAISPAPHAIITGPKQAIREDHLRFVQGTTLWAQKTKVLNRDWAELTFREDPTLQMLLDRNALKAGKGRYIGVNADPAIILANQRRFKKETDAGLCQWVTGKMEPLLWDPDVLQNVGILIFDAYETVANSQIDRTLLPVLDFAIRQKDRLGQFVLSCTFSLRGTRATRSKSGIQFVLDLLSDHFGVSLNQDKHTVTYRSTRRSQNMLMFRVAL